MTDQIGMTSMIIRPMMYEITITFITREISPIQDPGMDKVIVMIIREVTIL